MKPPEGVRPMRVPRAILAVLLAAFTVLAIAPLPAAAKSTRKADGHAKKPAVPDLTSSFDAFCDEWMEKLQVRERDNLANMKWDKDGDGVSGTYVGYPQKHTCHLADDDPTVGTLEYQEVRYQKHGTTVAEAERSTPRPLAIEETMEIIHYTNGKWDW